MNRVPLKIIALPVVGFAAIFLWWGCAGWGPEGLWMNLGTEFLGILVTVFYVDWIVDRHERQQWRATDDHIRRQLRYLVADLILTLRYQCEFFEPEDFDAMFEEEHVHISRAASLDEVAIASYLGKLDGIKIDDCAADLDRHTEALIRYFDRYHSRLAPVVHSEVLGLEQVIPTARKYLVVMRDAKNQELHKGAYAYALRQSSTFMHEIFQRCAILWKLVEVEKEQGESTKVS